MATSDNIATSYVLHDRRIGFPFPAGVKISLFITEIRVRQIFLLHRSRARGQRGVVCSLREENLAPARNVLPACINDPELTPANMPGREAVVSMEIEYTYKDVGDKSQSRKIFCKEQM